MSRSHRMASLELQSPTQSKTNFKVRSGGWGPCPVDFWNIHGWRYHCFSGKKKKKILTWNQNFPWYNCYLLPLVPSLSNLRCFHLGLVWLCFSLYSSIRKGYKGGSESHPWFPGHGATIICVFFETSATPKMFQICTLKCWDFPEKLFYPSENLYLALVLKREDLC